MFLRPHVVQNWNMTFMLGLSDSLSAYIKHYVNVGHVWRSRAQLAFKSSLPAVFPILKSEFQTVKGF